jgi:hypothetical protein
MARLLHRCLAAAYVLAVAAVLGFGAREAAAAPAGSASRACDIEECNQACSDAGYDYGRCTTYGCRCRFQMCGGVQC